MSSIEEEAVHLQIPLQEILDITENFSEQKIIAQGAFGNVYNCFSAKYGYVAIKQLAPIPPLRVQGDDEFRIEIALLSIYKHENIVSLVGFCDEEGQMILVYKFETNGSLHKHLHKDLTWIQRLQICLDAARGLQYLHDDAEPNHRILHGAIDSTNILLDENWKAKIADFGLSKVLPRDMSSPNLISKPGGTIGYMDPDTDSLSLTIKSDVYSFGVVLFEVLCGRASRIREYNDNREFLINLVKMHQEKNTLEEIIYSKIQEQIKKASLVTFSTIAYQCLMSGNERPTMKTVVEQLQRALNAQLNLKISLQELSDATLGFSEQNLIGSGGFGKVYKGESEEHGDIAVKLLNTELGQGDLEFKREIDLLSVYKHENIVTFIGFCDEDGKKILVYKFETNRSLDKHLRSTDLTWIQRLQICLDAARGLKYLHHDIEIQHSIIHRDVKSANILLGKNWKAKISDFGLSKMGPANEKISLFISNPCGTLGYIDPELLSTGYLTQRCDVYSFGIVLFEVLCGRLSYITNHKEKEECLSNLITTQWRRGTLDEIILLDLRKQIKPASLLTFKTIAYKCLMAGNERPTMKMVVKQLKRALKNQQAPSDDYFVAQPKKQAAEPLASSSSQSWKNDVFISFRGDDTCKTFVYKLYSALVYRQILTYQEVNNPPRRDELTRPSILKAIQESRIAIIVLSKNYVRSPWCLDELRFIITNQEKRGQKVIPVFYDVEPRDVRDQTGYYGEAFDMHKFNNNKVESWREALRNVAGLAGFEMKNEHESKAIKSICDDVSDRLLSLIPSSEASVETSAFTEPIGIETRMQELKSLLEVRSGGVSMVGICGMWGTGKSTLASYIYNKTNHDFEGCCFVKEVRARSRVHGLKVLQEEILSNVMNLKVTLTDIEQGLHMMRSRLRQNTVLIILDDVDHIDHLEMLAGSKDWFGKGSQIIFTTRNQDLVNAHNDTTYYMIKTLDNTEAIELFSRHAFGESKPIQGFEKDSQIIVSKCDRHPLALKIIGSFLHGKETSVWTGIMDSLEGMQTDEILKTFEKRDDGVVRSDFDGFQDCNMYKDTRCNWLKVFLTSCHI